MATSTGVFLRPDLDRLGRHPDVYGDDDEERVRQLAEALACGPLWAQLSARMRLVVRTEPVPLIAVLGTPDPTDRPLLAALGWQVPDCLDRLRPVGWDEAVSLAEVLAGRLADRLGDDLSAAVLVGVPRGGLIVAGLLSYALGVPSDRVARPSAHGEVTVVVDDCALSGARLHRWLGRGSLGPVVVAHLHSHPALRAALEEEAQIRACVGAADLVDHAPQAHGDGYEAWVARWRDRSPDDAWTGHTDHVVYPWNEPDVAIWNDVVERAVPGWRVVPPRWCLKNGSDRVAGAGVQRCSAGDGAVRPGPEVVWCELDGTVVVADAASGSAVTLTDVAADMWLGLVATGDRVAVAGEVAAAYDVDVERVADDLAAFVARCHEAGLLAG